MKKKFILYPIKANSDDPNPEWHIIPLADDVALPFGAIRLATGSDYFLDDEVVGSLPLLENVTAYLETQGISRAELEIYTWEEYRAECAKRKGGQRERATATA